MIRQIADGNRTAFEKLYNQYVRLVYSVAYSITGNKPDAEDVTADVFVTVWNKAGTCTSENVKSWLCTIAKNHSLTLVQKRKKSVELDELTFGSYQIERKVETKTLVGEALAILSEEERRTVLLFNAGYKHREIAEITGEPLGTLTWRYNNALKKMRKNLEAKDEK